MTDHAVEKMWQLINEGGDIPEMFKLEFARDCKEWGIIVAIYNLGFLMGK